MRKATNDYLIKLARQNVLAARQQQAVIQQRRKLDSLYAVKCKHVRLKHL